MKIGLPILFILTAATILPVPERAMATGPFLNLPEYYMQADTARALVYVVQSFVDGEFDNSTALSLAIAFRSGERTRVRMQTLFPVIRRNGYYNHGFADLLLNAELRIVGDSLRINGLFLRGDMRIPTGSSSLWPYAGESLDGGGGLELRKSAQAFDLRISGTYILVGRREEGEFYRSDNYALAGALLALKPFGFLAVEFSAFAQFFRNGDFREMYFLGARTRLGSGLDFHLCGGIDNGGSGERVWNSMVQVGVVWRWPAPWKRDRGPETNPPGGGTADSPGGSGSAVPTDGDG